MTTGDKLRDKILRQASEIQGMNNNFSSKSEHDRTHSSRPPLAVHHADHGHYFRGLWKNFSPFLGPECHRHRVRILPYLDAADSINGRQWKEDDNKCHCKNDKAGVPPCLLGLFPRRLGRAPWMQLSAGRSTHTHNVYLHTCYV